METKTIEIPLDKSKLRRMLSPLIAFMGLGVWIIIRPAKTDISFFHSPVLIYTVGIANILFWGVGIVTILKFLFSRKGVKISDEGIYDNSTSVSLGFIPWKDVAGIQKKRIFGQTYIGLIVRNSQSYIDRQTNFLKKKVLQKNYKSRGMLVFISLNFLKLKGMDIESLLKEHYHKFSV